MVFIAKTYEQLSKFFDVAFLVKFVILFIGLYYFDLGYLGLTNNGGGLYIPFLAKYGDYTNFIIKGILNLSNIWSHLFGLDTYIQPGNILRVLNGSAVWMARPCIGLVMVFFWMSFIISHQTDLRKKLTWCVFGAAIIFLINSMRVTLILLAQHHNWQEIEHMDHHAFFNYACYAVILVMILLYNRTTNKIKPKLKTQMIKSE